MKNKLLYLFACIFVLFTLSACHQHTHVYGAWSVTTEPTCTTEGIKRRTCECGDTQTESIPASKHSYGKWATILQPTCTNEGTKSRTCECGDTQTESIPASKHSYGKWTTILQPTCTNEGTKSRTCECGDTQTETLKVVSHSYNWVTTIDATCQNAGEKNGTCTTCNITTTETISKLSHDYGKGEITVAATCLEDGEKIFTCASCQTTKTEIIKKLGHSPNNNNICTRCNADCPVELNLTSSEIEEAKKVEFISERSIDDLSDEERFRLMFSLKDASENYLKVPVIVTIKITNDNNEIVYKAIKVVKASNYSVWTNSYGKKWTAAAIYIPYSDITSGSSDEGTVTFEVYNDYVSFDTSTLSIYRNLPLKETTINIPALPDTVHDYDYKDRITTSVKITEITYEISGDDLYIYFTGEKTHDIEGNRYSRACKVGWKLYDSEGYIVDSGTFYSPAIAVGEKFRSEKEYAWDVIKPGETYSLKISNVD